MTTTVAAAAADAGFAIVKLSSTQQEYSKDAVAHVQKYLMKNEVPVNLFEVRKKSLQFKLLSKKVKKKKKRMLINRVELRAQEYNQNYNGECTLYVCSSNQDCVST